MNSVKIRATVEIKKIDHMNASEYRPETWFINGFLNERKQKIKFVYTVNDVDSLNEFTDTIKEDVMYDIKGNMVVKIKSHAFVYINVIQIRDLEGNLIFN